MCLDYPVRASSTATARSAWHSLYLLERTLVCMTIPRSDANEVGFKIPRSDTNKVDEFKATVTSELHAQAERTKKQKREEKATSSGGSDKDPEPKDCA